jgi:hypothetical protein
MEFPCQCSAGGPTSPCQNAATQEDLRCDPCRENRCMGQGFDGGEVITQVIHDEVQVWEDAKARLEKMARDWGGEEWPRAGG